MAARKKITNKKSNPIQTSLFYENANKATKEIHEAKSEVLQNGLTEAIMGFDLAGMGTQLSQTDTLFRNLRWYMVSNMRQLLSELYVEHGLVQTIIDVPVDDGLRGGVDITSKQLSEDEIQKLHQTLERNNDLINVGQAMKWNRLYGGAALIILTNQNYEEPLDVSAITKDSPLEFRPVDMWELYWDKQNTEGYNLELQEHDFEFYNYYGKKVHKSRVLKMKGMIAPSFVRPRLRGWGFSVIEALVRSINQYLKANDLTFEVLDEFKVDVYKIKGLASTLLSSNGTTKIQQRVQLANQQKNYQHAITMDSEDDFASKELSFAGIAETMAGIRLQVASDLRMPISKLFGVGSTGFSSGQDDIENYNGMVESQIRSKCKFDILRVIELRSQQLFGYIPDDLTIDFKPLRILGAEAEENVKTQKFNRLLAAKQAGEMTTKEFKEACNRNNLLDIQLDVNVETLPVQKTKDDIEVPTPATTTSSTVAKEAPEGET